MFAATAASPGYPVGEPLPGGGEVGVPVQRAVTWRGDGENGEPSLTQRRQFFKQCAVLCLAGRNGSVVEGVAMGEPAGPVVQGL